MREHPVVCDDHGEDREMYATCFLAKGFRVQAAVDGEAAFRYAVDSRPDAIVMGLSRPRVDGWKATRRLTAEARMRDIPSGGPGDGAERSGRRLTGGRQRLRIGTGGPIQGGVVRAWGPDDEPRDERSGERR